MQLNQPIKLKLLRDQPLVRENGQGKYFMYAVSNESDLELVWFAPAMNFQYALLDHLLGARQLTERGNGKRYWFAEVVAHDIHHLGQFFWYTNYENKQEVSRFKKLSVDS